MAKSHAPMSLTARREAAAACEDKSLMQRQGSKEGEKGKATRLTVGNVTASKGLSKEAVLQAVQERLRGLESCFRRGELRGKLVLGLTIQSDGAVKGVKVLSGALVSERIRRCIIDQIEKWRFPATQAGRDVQATVTLNILS
jgi:hypothetical protein